MTRPWRVERRLRLILNDWKTWMLIAYLLIGVAFWGYIHVNNRTAREQAARIATARANAATQVGQCFTSAKNGPVTRGFVASNFAVIDSLLIANRQALQAQPTGPLTGVRTKSVARLRHAKTNAIKLRTLIRKSIPTKQKCVRVAHRLGVDPSRYLEEPTPR